MRDKHYRQGGEEEDARVSHEAHTLTKEESMRASRKSERSCVAHFTDKLLKLKGMMKTERGRELAEQRHEVMLSFLQQIQQECAVE